MIWQIAANFSSLISRFVGAAIHARWATNLFPSETPFVTLGSGVTPQIQWLAYKKRSVFRGLPERLGAISLLLDSSLPSANRRSIPPNVRGRQPVTPTDGAGAVPAGGGSSLPLSGGPGIDPAGITTGARGASLKRDAKAQLTPAHCIA
jgi:hypothetical protein